MPVTSQKEDKETLDGLQSVGACYGEKILSGQTFHLHSHYLFLVGFPMYCSVIVE